MMFISEIVKLYSVEQFIQIAAIVSFGALVQSSVGFGFAIFSMPLLLWSGLSLQQAIFITLACQIGQEVTGLYYLRNKIQLKELFKNLWVVMVSGVLFLIIGIMLLKKIERLDAVSLRRFVSVVILFLIALEFFCRPQRHKGLSKYWAILAGSTAGIMTGTIGITGPPLVLWVMAQNLSNQQTRGSIWIIFLSIMVPMLALSAFFYSESFVSSLLVSILLIPLVLAFSAIGVFVGNQIPKKKLRLIVYLLLMIVVLSSFIGK